VSRTGGQPSRRRSTSLRRPAAAPGCRARRGDGPAEVSADATQRRRQRGQRVRRTGGNRSWIDQLHVSHPATRDEALDKAWNSGRMARCRRCWPRSPSPAVRGAPGDAPGRDRADRGPRDRRRTDRPGDRNVCGRRPTRCTCIRPGRTNSASPTSAPIHSTFGTGHDGGRRAIPTIDVTRSSAASAGSTLLPTFPVAPVTTTRWEPRPPVCHPLRPRLQRRHMIRRLTGATVG
jgi:hypothetical protein